MVYETVRSLACQQSVFQRYHSEKHLSDFYPQYGGESQLALKLRPCHSMYTRQSATVSQTLHAFQGDTLGFKYVGFLRALTSGSVHSENVIVAFNEFDYNGPRVRVRKLRM